jgi:WD40 repeat protein
MFWATRSGKLQRVVKLPDWPTAIAFTPTGHLVAGCADRLVRLLDQSTGVIKRTINTENSLTSLAVSPDGRYLATAIPIKVWNLESGQVLGAFQAAGYYGLTFAPLGEYLASAEHSGGAKVWSVPTGELRQTLRINVQKKMLGPSGYELVLVNMPASAVVFSRDGTWIATGGTDSAVQLWKVPSDAVAPANQAPARVFTGHMMTVTGVSFSPDGRRLASASLDRTVRVWELR